MQDALLKQIEAGAAVHGAPDRLEAVSGRDLRHSINPVGDLMKRNVGLKVLLGEGASIDTDLTGILDRAD